MAKELCEEGAVSINGQRVRAGREVSPGDTLELTLRNRRLAVEIVDIPSRPPMTADASDFYRIISDERIEDAEHAEHAEQE